jgi:hypothetical protein
MKSVFHLFLLSICLLSCRDDKAVNDLNAENTLLKAEIDSLKKVIASTVINKEVNSKYNCAPKNYNPKILSSPNHTAVHTDWAKNEVGTSWSFFATTKIKNDSGEFYVGNLVNPRGQQMNKEAVYVIASEWVCN